MTPALTHWYRQEAEVVPFTCWPWLMAVSETPDISAIHSSYERAWCYCRAEGIGYAYWDAAAMERLALDVYRYSSDPAALESWWRRFTLAASELEQAFLTTSREMVLNLDEPGLKQFFSRMWEVQRAYWLPSLFIDSFDPGTDQRLVQAIAAEQKFSLDEIAILTTPTELTFNQERLLVLYGLADRLSRQDALTDRAALLTFVKQDDEARRYVRAFDCYKSNFVHIRHITEDEMADDLARLLQDSVQLQQDLRALETYSEQRQEAVSAVLRRHRLTANPLVFFQKLTYWRESRKKANLMGFHLLDLVLQALEGKTGVAKKYLQYLGFDEIDAVLKGTITQAILKKRYEEGVLIMVDRLGYKMVQGEQAESLRNECESQRETEPASASVQGQVASQGYAKGRARIILGLTDFSKFKDGEILITGMTRPEFVPLMKRAAAIVTNEGGVTCHAAIVSRELGKPCIIGTKIATDVIHDGDLIEVRATHGTVRILERAQIA